MHARDIISPCPSEQENEAKQASAELESQTQIQQLALDVERLKTEKDYTSKKWRESVEQLQTVTENLDAAKAGTSLWVSILG